MGESIVVLMGQAMAKLRAVEKDRRFDGPGGFNFRGIDAVVADEDRAIITSYKGGAHKEAVRAFLEKRQPRFNAAG